MSNHDIVLTGDRPTGPLHLGHYVGSLEQRLTLQHQYTQYVMIADVQAFTDNYENPKKIKDNILQVALDYLAIGIDPSKSTIFIQSMIPAIAEITILFLNLVTLNRLKRNPTIKTEIAQKGYGEHVTAGFLMYPISQAADITVVKGTLVPVGEDQLPIIEQTNEIIRTFNRIYHTTLFKEVRGLVSKVPRLPGIDGKHKMSKSLGNAILLSDSADKVKEAVMKMYTDPNHIKVSDPGQVEGNMVFTYLDIFDPDTSEVARLKEHYQKGGLGDVVLKRRLIDVLNAFLDPIRRRRADLEKDPEYVINILKSGTERVNIVADTTLQEFRQAICRVFW